MQDKMNKIHLGDSLELMKELPDNCVDLIVTDPPYELNNNGEGNHMFGKSIDKIKYGLVEIDKGFDIDEYFTQIKRVCKKFNAFVFCSNDQLIKVLNAGNKYADFVTTLVWHKSNSTPFSNGVWRPDIEFCVHIRAKGAYFQGGAKIKKKVTTLPMEKSRYGHPTEKPLELIEKYIQIGSDKDDVVLDPFMGSGTTANACINLDRQFIGYEIDPKYHAIACERVEKAKGNFGLFEGLE